MSRRMRSAVLALAVFGLASLAFADAIGGVGDRGPEGPMVEPAEVEPPVEPAETMSFRAPRDAIPTWALNEIPRREASSGRIWARARWHDAPIYSTRDTRFGLGRARRSATIRATSSSRNGRCDGRWLHLAAGGFACTTHGFDARDERPPPFATPTSPAEGEVVPYRYAAVVDRTAHRYRSLPTRHEWERTAEGRPPRSAERLDGDYFVTVDAEVTHLGERFVRTARRRFVPASALEAITPSRFHGEHDPEGLRLPIAFVIEDGARVSHFASGAAGRLRAPIGRAERYARFPVAREVSVRGRAFVVDASGRAVPRDAVRVARAVERPEGVPEGERWVHVDLGEQILTAWEGDTPVFATMVSSGKEGYETPTGVFRVTQKYVSTTMRGDDPVDGVYDVGEVPWTLFYDGSYALHGAYWHDGFGETRSHGCTNIAPADARWLFSWSTPVLPEGWHGMRESGTWVVMARAD